MENEVKKEITFKERLIQIYNDLDELDVEAAQEEINKLKDELDVLIKNCDEASVEKDEKIMQDLIEQQSMSKSVAMYHTKVKPTIISTAVEEKDKKEFVKNAIIIALLTLTCIALLIALKII